MNRASRSTRVAPVNGLRSLRLSRLTLPARPAQARWLLLAILLGSSAALVFAVYQYRPAHTVHVGTPTDDKPYVAGMFQPEQGPFGRYRWTGAESTVRLPGMARGPWRVTLSMAGGANPRPRVSLLVNGVELADLELQAGFREYVVAVPADVASDGDLVVTLRSTTFQPPNDRRTLGVVLDRVAVQPTGNPGLLWPPLTQAARLLALTLLAYVIAVVAGFGSVGGVVVGGSFILGLSGILLVNRPWLTIWTGQLLAATAAALVLTLLLRLVTPPLFRRVGLELSGDEVRWPVLLAATFFVAHFGGDLHPHINIVDIGFHIHRFEDVNDRGRWLLMVQSREWGTRDTVYPPAAYLVMRPLRWVTPDIRTAIVLFIALAEATRLMIVYLVTRKATGDRWAGVFAAVVFGIVPMAYLPFSWGIATNVFGAWCITAFFALLVLGYDRLRHPVPALLMFAVLTLGLLSHPGEFVLLVATVGVVLVTYGLALRPRFRGSWPVLFGVATLAALVAFALLYRYVAEAMLSQGGDTFRTKLAGGTAQPGWRVGGAIDDPIIGLQGYRVTTVPALIWGGLVGYWREAVGYYYLWPVVLALLALKWPASTPGLARLRLASAVWWTVAALFALVGLVLNVYVRYAYYLLPVIAIGAGVALGGFVRRGRWANVVTVLLLGVTSAAGLWFWYLRITYDGH